MTKRKGRYMRLVVLSCLALATAACATEKPPAPAPGAFERVADRLSDPASETPCLLYAYCHGKDYGKRRLERETDRNPVDRRDSIVVATALGDNQRAQSVIRQDKASERPASDPKPNLPVGAKSADTPN
jgi:hypothetical protein